jgi:hypothetical protein
MVSLCEQTFFKIDGVPVRADRLNGFSLGADRAPMRTRHVRLLRLRDRFSERDFSIDNLLDRIHLVVEKILVCRPCAMAIRIPLYRCSTSASLVWTETTFLKMTCRVSQDKFVKFVPGKSRNHQIGSARIDKGILRSGTPPLTCEDS